MIIALPREQEGIILIPMAKKEYLSPEMKEVRFNVESLLQTISGGAATCPSKCDTDCLDDCDDDL